MEHQSGGAAGLYPVSCKGLEEVVERVRDLVVGGMNSGNLCSGEWATLPAYLCLLMADTISNVGGNT